MKNKTKQEATSPGGQKKQASTIRQSDPHFARETEQYENPLPSREFVEQVLADRGVPMTFEELCAALDVSTDEAGLFERRFLVRFLTSGCENRIEEPVFLACRARLRCPLPWSR